VKRLPKPFFSLLLVILLAAHVSAGTITLENFEFASSTANAQAGASVTPYGAGNTGTLDSGSGANASQGTYALQANLNFGTDAYNDLRIVRTLAAPITLTTPLTAGELVGSHVLIDIKGAAALGDKSFYVFLVDSDGEKFRFISGSDTAVTNPAYTVDHSIAFTDADPYDGVSTDNKLSAIAAVEIDLADNTTGGSAVAEAGTLYVDNLRFVEPVTLPSNYKTITIDGDASDWGGISPAYTDASGDGGTGRDIQAVYLANDSTSLYVRIDSYNSDAFDGNELTGIDGDNSAATGFSLFGTASGSDSLAAGATLYGESTGNFNTGLATPSALTFAPYTAATTIEFAIPLNATIPAADIAQSFPGGLGSTISVVFGDSNAGASDVTAPIAYKLASPPAAGVFRSIAVDGAVADWLGVVPLVTDATGDGGTGRDVKAIYVANDSDNLYVRIESYNSVAYNGNEFTGIDGDNATATGFNLYGLGIGSDLLVAGASGYGEITSNFNNGAATPATFPFAPVDATTDVEYSIPLNTIVPGDISTLFPGGIGSTIQLCYGDDNAGAGDKVGPFTYTLAAPSQLVYAIPLISSSQAPNVTDSSFDAIYSAGGAHPVITGSDWKDYAQRASDPFAAIAEPIASTSKAYLITDGTYLYFGMKVYDPNTALLSADSGDDTFTKYAVEDVEVGFSSQQGAAGAADAAKFSMDAFNHIDDMLPDGHPEVDTSAKTMHHSYIIDTNTWAMEFAVRLDQLIGNSALANPLPAAPGPWYGHIGYQSPFVGGNPRVPLYAAAHANGFGNFQIKFDLQSLVPNAAHAWSCYE
jgi:hypothetical protein